MHTPRTTSPLIATHRYARTFLPISFGDTLYGYTYTTTSFLDCTTTPAIVLHTHLSSLSTVTHLLLSHTVLDLFSLTTHLSPLLCLSAHTLVPPRVFRDCASLSAHLSLHLSYALHCLAFVAVGLSSAPALWDSGGTHMVCTLSILSLFYPPSQVTLWTHCTDFYISFNLLSPLWGGHVSFGSLPARLPCLCT